MSTTSPPSDHGTLSTRRAAKLRQLGVEILPPLVQQPDSVPGSFRRQLSPFTKKCNDDGLDHERNRPLHETRMAEMQDLLTGWTLLLLWRGPAAGVPS
jgi:hypothetical protein